MKYLLCALTVLCLTACQPGAQPTTAQPSTGKGKQKVGSFFTSSLQAPVGWQIKEVRGFECRFFEYSGTPDYVERLKGVLRGIAEDGLKSGANAFLNARLSSESHEVASTKTRASIVHVCGDYVVIE